MKDYERKNRAAYAGAAAFIFIANGFAVVLQFFKGNVLDSAVAGQADAALRYGLLLIGFILLEIAFFYLHRIFSAKFVTGCTKSLKHDIFKSILRRSYVAYRERLQGEYISKYTNEADMISARRFTVLPMFWNVLFKIIAISTGLFILDARIAVVTLFLLTTPLYIPKLIEKRLQRIQSEYLKAVEVSLAKVSDWLSGFEVIKNFSIERKILERFEDANNAAMRI
jgi:ABC-type multidrug transport system fused ATPase/permease subunit